MVVVPKQCDVMRGEEKQVTPELPVEKVAEKVILLQARATISAPKVVPVQKPKSVPPPSSSTNHARKEYKMLQVSIAKRLANIDLDVLFNKVDVDRSGGLNRKEFLRLLIATDKTLTTKDMFGRAWKDATQGNVQQTDIYLEEFKEWIKSCSCQVLQ